LFAVGTDMEFVIGTYEGYVIFMLSLTKTSVEASAKLSVITVDTA
jgi:hypothetical protein